MTDDVSKYIYEHWDDTVRYNPENNGNLIGLPEKYTVPCIKEYFQELYYWDTYFTCRGLALHGRKELVRANVENFFYEINKFGFIPNGNRTFYLNRSQPAFLGALVQLVMTLFPGDGKLKMQALEALCREVDFWDYHRRDAATGLYHYGSAPSEEELAEFFQLAVDRCGILPVAGTDAECRREIGLAALAEAESGWDFTPRFEGHCPDCAAIDLNSLLYLSMTVIAELSDCAKEKQMYWQKRADELKTAVKKYCIRPDGAFTDYNFKQKKQVEILSAASLFPLWTGMADAEEAAAALKMCREKLEQPFGISSTEKYIVSTSRQWEYPNGWPCLQMIAFEAFARYGYIEDAKRIAVKYINTVKSNFEKSGELWEKYNVVDGSITVNAEYSMPSMMGWTAGTYLVAGNLIRNAG